MRGSASGAINARGWIAGQSENGEIDPASGIPETRAVLWTDAQVIDLGSSTLVPGLIDLHGHWYEGGLYGIDADIGLNHGVTTAVDAGTAGFANFPERAISKRFRWCMKA